MNFKLINLLGIVLVFIGLFSLMFVHLNHDAPEEQWEHIKIGFPLSIFGVLLLIIAEKEQLKIRKNS